MKPAAISIEQVSKHYGRLVALEDVSLSLEPGERLALLGHNGAGKTTMIKLILGLTRPNSGRIEVLGAPPGAAANRQRTAYLPENVAFHRLLTGREQLGLYARLKSETAAAVPRLLDRVGLADAMDRRIGGYSKGMRQRLGLAQLMLGRPDIVILDEPTSGLDPLSRETFYGMISELADNGAAVLLSSHALTELEARTDRIAILRSGAIVADDRLASLRRKAQLPTRLRIEVHPDKADEVANRLGATRVNGHSVELVCGADDKIARLAEVAAFGGSIQDVDIVPPSLEDIYRHYSRTYSAGGPMP